MPYEREFLKLSFLYLVVNGDDETAVTSIDYTGFATPFSAATALGELAAADGTAILALWNTFIGGDKGWADYSSLIGIKIAAVGTDGHYVADPLLVNNSPVTSGTMPSRVPQASTVVTLRSATNLGKGNYGRMYVPHFHGDLLDNSPKLFPADTAALAGAFKVFLNGTTARLNTAVTAALLPAIMSQAGGGITKPIARVGVGDVVDTQRRRRNKLNEAYSYVTVP